MGTYVKGGLQLHEQAHLRGGVFAAAGCHLHCTHEQVGDRGKGVLQLGSECAQRQGAGRAVEVMSIVCSMLGLPKFSGGVGGGGSEMFVGSGLQLPAET
jgi:hypothetical protein